ncbi:response regulator [Bosea beijingensis]
MPVVVLLVEDDPLISMDVETSLNDAGFDVVSVSTGNEAIQAFDKRADAIRAVITDIRLGKGITGWEVGRYVRRAIPTLPVIYMSGDSSGDWAHEGVPNSVMIAKPFAFSQIISAIAGLLNDPDQVQF